MKRNVLYCFNFNREQTIYPTSEGDIRFDLE